MNKANQQKEMSPREGTAIRDPLILILRNPMKTLNWKQMWLRMIVKIDLERYGGWLVVVINI